MKLNNYEFIKAVSEKTGFNRVDSKNAIRATFDTITETLASGDSVKLVGFGSFNVAVRKERLARNPKTGEKILISTKRVPVFKAGKELKNAVKQ